MRIIFDTTSSVTGLKKIRLEGVSFGAVRGDSFLGTDFRAVCSLKIFAEKEVANIWERHLADASDYASE